MYKKQKGFTLVEMIIVTVIIGILAGMVITVINIPRTQARARDSRRVGDLKRIQSALELYFSDRRGYPISSTWQEFTSSLINDGGEAYMNQVPVDPRTTESPSVNCFGGVLKPYGYYYITDLNGATYVLGAIMEMNTTVDANTTCSSICESSYQCSTDSHCYCVQNPM